jgi:hypothetical protein
MLVVLIKKDGIRNGTIEIGKKLNEKSLTTIGAHSEEDKPRL